MVQLTSNSKFGHSFMAALLGSFFASMPASAQNASSSASAWSVNCGSKEANKKSRCQMSQRLIVKKTGQRILNILVRPVDGSDRLTLIFSMPHGLHLPSGAVIAVDEAPSKKLEIQASDSSGVYAAVPLSNEMIAAMKSGAVLKVGLTNSNRKPINLNVSLTGFTKSIAELVVAAAK